MTKKEQKTPPLEAGIVQAMQALDRQIARRMERSPGEREEKGVQKWDPFSEKIEEVVTLVLDELGHDNVKLDSLIVLSQAMTKALYLLIEELGEEGLGTLRSAYCRQTIEAVERDCSRAAAVLNPQGSQLN